MGFRCWLVSLLFVSLPVGLATPSGAVGDDHYIAISADQSLAQPVVIDPLHQALAPGDTVTWDNTQWNRYVDIDDPSGNRWCRLWGDSSGEWDSRCTIDPGLPAGIHGYTVTHQTDGARTAFLCVTEASVVNITSPPAGQPILGSVQVAGTASSDLGIDRVEVRVIGGAWSVADGTSSWSAEVFTQGATAGANQLEARLIYENCSLATDELAVFVQDPPVLDLAVTRMYAQRQQDLLGTVYDIEWEAVNAGNTPATVRAHLERKDGSQWVEEQTIFRTIQAYSQEAGYYHSGPMADGLKWRLRLEVLSSQASDLTPLDHVAYWPPGGDGATPTIVAKAGRFDAADLTLDEGSQVAWQWSGADHGIIGPGGQVWCTPTDQLGRLCYLNLPSAGRFDYQASDNAAISGILRLPGAPPTFDFVDLGPDPVSGTIVFAGTASSPHGVRFLELRIGDGDWFDVEPASWSLEVDTLGYLNGPLVLAARATGEDDSVGEDSITLTVDNPLVPDLSPTALTVTDGTLTDPVVRIVATIENLGNTQATVDVILRGYEGGAWRDVDRRTVTVDAFSEVRQFMRWRCETCIGGHTAQVVVDPDGLVSERDEDNNARYTRVTFRSLST